MVVLDPLVVAALETNALNLALGNEVFERAGARFVRNSTYPSVLDANHVDSVTARSAEAIRALFEATEAEYGHADSIRFDVDARTPTEFEAALAFAGYETDGDGLVMVLEGSIARRVKGVDIRPVMTDELWADFSRVHALAWEREDGSTPFGPEVEAPTLATMGAKSPPTRFWLAYVDNVPVGGLNSWEGVAGVGQIETMFVHPAYRHRGIATALLSHGVLDARAHGASAVAIVTSADDTPKRMYADLGWRPVAVKREYRRGRAKA